MATPEFLQRACLKSRRHCVSFTPIMRPLAKLTPRLARCWTVSQTLDWMTTRSSSCLAIMGGVLANILCGTSMLRSTSLYGLLS